MSNSTENGTYSVGVDIGGTFTDCVVRTAAGGAVTGKVPTTPKDRSIGFFGSIEEAAGQLGLTLPRLLQQTGRLVHGTTTGVNAVVSRSGAKVGLITTAGHGDVMLMMKGGGRTAGLAPDLIMDEFATRRKPQSFVPRSLTIEVEERVDRDGEIVVPLDRERATARIQALLDRGVEAIAVSLLWSIKNPAHEQILREIVEQLAPGVYVSCGSELASRIGEFERTVSAVLNAYIGPLMVRYIDSIAEGARAAGFGAEVLFAQSAGGAISAAEAKRSPVLTMMSGPVAGVMNSVFFGGTIGEQNLITADMGGTTFDVSVVRKGEPLSRDVTIFEQFDMAIPMLDIESIGAGGGSIAWIDDSERINVGPQSAGAEPGPACYGRGGLQPTVTDADVVLGIIDPDSFLHGEFPIDPELSRRAIAQVGDRLGLGVPETASGINRIVDAKMADLIRRMTEFRGDDPRAYTLLAFGGGGAVHAAACARDAGVRRVIVPTPELAPVWSAGGASALDIVHTYQEPRLSDFPVEPYVLENAFAELEVRAIAQLAGYGFQPGQMRLTRHVRMKHTMQIYDVEVPVDFDLLAPGAVDRLDLAFSEIYEQRFGKNSGFRAGGVQISGFQVRAEGSWSTDGKQAATDAETVPATWGQRDVYWSELEAFVATPVLRMADARGCRVDDVLSGPALIEVPNTVIVVRPGQTAAFDRYGNVLIDLPDRQPGDWNGVSD